MVNAKITYNYAGKEYAQFYPLLVEQLAAEFKKRGKDFQKELYKATESSTIRVIKELKKMHSKPYPRGSRSNNLSARSGKGVQGLRYTIRKEKDGLQVTSTMYVPLSMWVHEQGKYIKSNWMTIPTKYALKSNGTPKYLSPWTWKNTYVWNHIIWQRKKNAKPIPLYILVKNVHIPGGRLHMADVLEKETVTFKNTFLDRAQKILQKAAK